MFNKNKDSIKIAVSDYKIEKKMIAVHSCSPGSGATTLLNSIAKILAEKDKSVAVIDLNNSSRNIAICSESKYSLGKYLSSSSSIKNYINTTPHRNIRYLGSADDDDVFDDIPLIANNAYVDLIRNKLDDMYKELYDIFDCILVDCGNFTDLKSCLSASLADRQIWLCDNSARGLLYLESDLQLVSDKGKVSLVTVDKYVDVDTKGMYDSTELPILGNIKHSSAIAVDIAMNTLTHYTSNTKPRDYDEAIYQKGLSKVISHIYSREV